MRYSIIGCVLLLAVSCNQPKLPAAAGKIVIHDTIRVKDNVTTPRTITVTLEDHSCCDSNRHLRAEADGLGGALLRSQLQLATIRHYVTVCNNSPKQDKYLKGWINRALKE